MKTPEGRTIVDQDDNLFLYVIEPALWGTKRLQLTYRAIQPALSAKDPALARQIARGYAAILKFTARTNALEQSGKMSARAIEELAYQATKALTD